MMIKTNIGKKLLLGTLLTTLTLNLASAATYYVTQAGAGAGHGSNPENAWSVAKFNTVNTTTGGDTVIFSGTINSTVAPAANGSSDSNRTTLDFRGATLNDANPRIRIVNRSNLTLLGGQMGTSADGILISFNAAIPGSSNITIDGFKWTGTATSTTGFVWGNYCTNLLVQNNTIDNARCFFGADSVLNSRITLRNNYARTSLNTTAQTDVVSIGDANGVTIEGNKFVMRTEGNWVQRHNDILQCYQKGGGSPGNPTNWVIRYNWFELDVKTGSGDNSFFMFEAMGGSTALICHSNVFLGAETGGAGNNGISVGANLAGATYHFYNNTVVRKRGPNGTWRLNGPGTMFARNNIAVATPGQTGVYVEWAMTNGGYDHNFFYNFGSLAGASPTYVGARGSTTTDPQFVDYAGNDFALGGSSPLKGRGDSSIGANSAPPTLSRPTRSISPERSGN